MLEKAKLVVNGKELRQKTRSSRNNISREKDSTEKTMDCKTTREKSVSRERLTTKTMNQSSDKIDL